MAKKEKKPRLVRTTLGVLTRVEWTGTLLVSPNVTNMHELTDAVYEHVDGSEFTDDEHYWERSKETCESGVVKPDADEPQAPGLVAFKDADGDVCVVDVPENTDPAEFLAKCLGQAAKPKDEQP